ncbi:MAG: 3-phosphoshikimate 1-carboxyvinyltransferase [Candidatus Dadabacteria bacterium]|nr:3-phosphoshikimate 1-carboxyvinyltransferase [Candidatus Dadabacteria bacterium]NIQ15238.1 3-phosphoshikimate 1-carboxyvinyltransferase [Candidatus Dadabacteria bacterium]
MSKTIISGNSRSLKGEIIPPGDKSISHRAIMIGSLAEGQTNVTGFLNGEDTLSTVNAFRNLGIEINIDGTNIKIEGKGLYGLSKPKTIIDAGNSGTTIRLLTGILSAQDFNSEITGDKYLRTRPMARIIDPLAKMGADITSENSNKLLPLKIRGRNLKAIKYTPPIPSAQVKSCLLLAGLFADGTTEITEKIKTRDHTERMLRYFGVKLDIDSNKISVKKQSQFYGKNLNIPSDISSAAFFIVGALINKGSEVLIKNIGLNPERTGILELLEKMGANIEIKNEKIECGEPVGDLVVKYSKLKGIEIKGDQIPKSIDELPIITVAACFAEGQTIIKDARELRVKETDRIKAMTTELNKLKADITETEDGMIINGIKSLKGDKCSSWGDHRIAMSIAIAATRAEGDTEINDSDCVNISFPEFFKYLKKLRS